MAVITGRVEVLVNGELLMTKQGAKASGIGISGQPNYKRNPVLGDSGLHGFVEEPIVARCECTITDSDEISLSSLASVFNNGTVIFRAARGGKSYQMDGATCEGDLEITGGEGETSIAFVGAYWTEL